MTQDEILIHRLADVLASRIHPAIPLQIALWDAEQIAAYLGLAARTVAERVACKPDFPRPIRLNDGVKQTRRWKAAEVIEWAESRQDKKRS